MTFTITKRTALEIIAVIVITLIAVYLYTSSKAPTDVQSIEGVPLAPIATKTSLGASYKVSEADADLKVTQTYKAEVNGQTVIAPIEGVDNGKGVQGTITQEIDLKPITQMQRELDKKEFQKNWEGAVGLGVHKGDFYIPVEVQRNYAKDKALALEVHLKVEDKAPKVTGVELKHKWLF